MEVKTKLRILSWAMVLLIIFNLTVIITVFSKMSNNLPNDNNFLPNNPDNQMQFNPHQQEDHFREVLIRELNLDKNQIEKLDVYRIEFLKNSHLLFDSIRIYSNLIDDELEKDNPDKEFIIKNSYRIGNVHRLLKMNFVEYYLNLKSILNNEQQKKFHKVILDFKKEKQFNHKKCQK